MAGQGRLSRGSDADRSGDTPDQTPAEDDSDQNTQDRHHDRQPRERTAPDSSSCGRRALLRLVRRQEIVCAGDRWSGGDCCLVGPFGKVDEAA
jgi:hypothetical protein